VSDETVTDAFRRRSPDASARHRKTALYVVLRANAPLEPPTRHLLDGIDVVCFGRGKHEASRDEHAGLRRLTVRVPDPIMSTDHGRLLHVQGQWILEDPRSKNGAVVDGRPTRCATVNTGNLFELGHTLFLLTEVELPEGTPKDIAADKLAGWPELETFHPQLASDLELLERVATSDVPVLLLGESGTGKEVVARGLHQRSGRRGAFVAVNCGGLPATLLEAELFGHRKGAFSGAVAERPGYLRSADHGTLFMDEIGELPLPAQASLLRALQEREVVPLGDSLPVRVDLRICAATNRDLTAFVKDGSFREDLYARLLGVTVALPPVRERKPDLGLLIRALLRRLPNGDRAKFTPDAAHALLRYHWPLNVRELERALAAAVAIAGRDPIDVQHLPATLAFDDALEAAPSPSNDEDDKGLRERLVASLTRHNGKVTAVATELGKHREQIHRWARRFGIDLESFKR
jgi:transcriptional regulator with PAS, ATPase and Fis domain